MDSKLVPDQCSSFIPTERSLKQKAFSGRISNDGMSPPTMRYPGYEAVTDRNLNACMDGLYAEPRAWNSYTNAKQNAIGICQATRAFVEKDETVHFYKAMHGVTADFFDVQSKSTEEMKALHLAFSGLVHTVEETIQSIQQEDLKREAGLTQKWAEWFLQMQGVSQGIQQIQDQVDKANLVVDSHGQAAARVFIDYKKLIDDFYTQLTKDVDLSYSQLERIHDRAVFVTEMVEQGVIQKLYGINDGLDVSNALVETLRQNANLAHLDALNLRGVITDSGKLVVVLQEDLDILVQKQRRNHLELLSQSNQSLAAVQQMKDQIDDTSAALSILASIPAKVINLFRSLSIFSWPLSFFLMPLLWVTSFSTMMVAICVSAWIYQNILSIRQGFSKPLRYLFAPASTLPWWLIAAAFYYSTIFTFVESPSSVINRYQNRGWSVAEMIAGGTLIALILATYAWKYQASVVRLCCGKRGGEAVETNPAIEKERRLLTKWRDSARSVV